MPSLSSTVKVSLFWDGEILYDNNAVRYSNKSKAHAKFPPTLDYQTLLNALHRRMKTNRECELFVVGRYPTTIAAQGLVLYASSDSDEIPNAEESDDDDDDDDEVDVNPRRPDAFVYTREDDPIRHKLWKEPVDLVRDQVHLAKCMMFESKKALQRAVKIYSYQGMREFKVDDSTRKILRLHDSMWIITKFYPRHTCDMGENQANHFNLDTNMIAQVLLVHVAETPRYSIKDCFRNVKETYRKMISKTKGYLGRRRAFEMIYGTWDGSFQQLLSYMEALQKFNPGTVVEWKLVASNIFNLVFWRFKSCIDGFAHYRPVISIDGTHVYGVYDIKLLIAVGMDANELIFPLAFVIAANESNDTWRMLLTHLRRYVVKDRMGICVLSN
ncbi:uncharacterized protein LOC132045411 [Lycium ferocissimum]|uniref:uncharacterized protein LOC132045411 n=1 Tax=Lycium ferocissimum TaxID=112874 RepID=UPI002814A14F|nr:uncharacterized protein LOC132045411 [Lycium ferocissimum]